MLSDALPTILIATALGFLSGLGVGGGSLLILWITLVMHMDAESARLLNLLFFLPSALIASVFHRTQGRLNIRRLLPGIIGGCVAAAVFSFIGKQLDTVLLKKAFGVLLLLTGLRECIYKPKLSDDKQDTPQE